MKALAPIWHKFTPKLAFSSSPYNSNILFQVQDVNGDLVLNTTESQLATARRPRTSHVKATSNDVPIIVVGGGISAAAFVEQARLNGCMAPITMITEDEHPPYDRVLLSKKPASEAKDIRLRSDDYYKENFINVIPSARVTGVDLTLRKVTLWTGDTMQYSKLVLALGAKPMKLSCPGADLKNVYNVRNVSDANAIAAHAPGKHVVCIGGSFIGMEIASALMGTAAFVTVVCNTDEPLPVLGVDVGCVIRNRFEGKGIRVVTKATVTKLEGTDVVTGVTIDTGETIPADVVVVGIGVEPPTDWLKNTRVELDERGFIKVDERFRTTADFVYAIGDVASAPLPLWDIDNINIQHFQTAQAHGKYQR
ncbi:pyridine nucleotide-disulfide oxidoreductase [Oesophagostomum dentatum]|uniref:Pyridine nucleotide-disulfide oxidoreductase n=1 Tax=Oesophagostomum dentatum TaxID=61180 RepID=A0A0B1T331_OESDE|nr:pyridine nucleotide-disulfide oxidoreductase [Oesophagostomum dentatum]